MASNPFFSGRIPQPLLDAIEAHREQTEESKTEVLTRALAKYIGYELDEEKPSIPPIQEKLDEIFYRLEKLEKQLITPDNKSKSIVKQLKIASDNSQITKDESNADSLGITSDNKVQILSTKSTVALIGKGCSSTSLNRWKRQNDLPKVVNGYQISSEGKGKWKITRIDNADN